MYLAAHTHVHILYAPPVTSPLSHPPFPCAPLAVNTNGNITVDEEMGEVIQLQGDQRQLVKDWLLDQEVVSASDVDRIVIHGF